MSVSRDELIGLLEEAEARGDMDTANAVLDRLEAMQSTEQPAREYYGDPIVKDGQYQVGGEVPSFHFGRDVVVPNVEAAATLATGAAGDIAGNIVGGVQMYADRDNPLAGPQARDFISDMLTYKPRSEGAKRLLQGYVDKLRPINEIIEKARLHEQAADAGLPVWLQKNAAGIPEFLGAPLAGLGYRRLPGQRGEPQPIDADEIIALGEKHGVPVHYDDVGGNMAQRVNVSAERIPVVGTGGGKAKQQAAVNEATTRLSERYYIDDDIPELVQEGLQTKLANAKDAASELFVRVATLVDPAGEIPLPKFRAEIKRQLDRQKSLGTAADPALVAILEKYADAPGGNFTHMKEIREQISDEVSKYYTGGAAIGNRGVGHVQAIKSALDDDMKSFAYKTSPEARAAWNKANAFYQKMVVPYKQTGLRQLVQTDEPQKAWRYLVQQSAGKARAKKMYLALDSQGRNAVKSGLIQDAIEYSKSPKGDISPAKFARYMENHSNAVDQFFGGTDLREIKGFQKLMRHVERAGQYTENPPTGQRFADVAMGGGVVAAAINPAVLKFMAAIGASGVAVKALFQTKAGRNALIKANNAQAGSKALDAILASIASLAIAQERRQPQGQGQETKEPTQ